MIAIDGTRPDVWVARGSAYGARRGKARQIADYEKALEVAPKDWPPRGEIEGLIKRLRGGS